LKPIRMTPWSAFLYQSPQLHLLSIVKHWIKKNLVCLWFMGCGKKKPGRPGKTPNLHLSLLPCLDLISSENWQKLSPQSAREPEQERTEPSTALTTGHQFRQVFVLGKPGSFTPLASWFLLCMCAQVSISLEAEKFPG
jgi:hypothetical protein